MTLVEPKRSRFAAATPIPPMCFPADFPLLTPSAGKARLPTDREGRSEAGVKTPAGVTKGAREPLAALSRRAG